MIAIKCRGLWVGLGPGVTDDLARGGGLAAPQLRADGGRGAARAQRRLPAFEPSRFGGVI